MASACLFIGWNRPVVGKEAEAMSYIMREGIERIEKFRKEGWFESSQFVGLTPHGGDLNGFIVLNGERAKLDEMRRTDAFESFVMKTMLLFSGFGVVPGVTADGLSKVAERNPQLFKS